MSHVKYHCELCKHTAFAPPDKVQPCRENKGPDCEMEQVEVFPAPEPVKAVATKKETSGSQTTSLRT